MDAIRADSVWRADITALELPLPAGKVSLPGFDFGMTLAELFLTAPVVLFFLLIAAILGVRRSSGEGSKAVSTFLIMVPFLAMIFVAWRFSPFIAAQPHKGAAGVATVFASGFQAYLIFLTATVVAYSAAAWFTLLLAVMSSALLGAVLWIAHAVNSERPGSGELIAAGRMLLGGGLWILLLIVIEKLFTPFGFRPWRDATSKGLAHQQAPAISRKVYPMILLFVSPIVLIASAGMVFAEPRPLDLSGKTLAVAAPKVAPDPAMVVAQMLHSGGRTPPEEAWELAEEHAWRHAKGLDLRGYHLDGADFTGSKLFSTDFRGASLRNAVFKETRIRSGRFDIPCLAGATFWGAILAEPFLSPGGGGASDGSCSSGSREPQNAQGENLGADRRSLAIKVADQSTLPIDGQQLATIDFTGAVLIAADFPKLEAIAQDGSAEGKTRCVLLRFPDMIFNQARIEDGNLECRDLHTIKMASATFERVNFSDSVLPDFGEGEAPFGFRGSEMPRVRLGGVLSGVDFENVNLTDADLSGSDLREANLKNATLVQATMIEVNLADANVHEADFSEAKLRDAVFPEFSENNRPKTFRGAELGNTTLVGVLQNTNFDLARLDRADLSAVTSLGDASFRGAILRDAKLPAFDEQTRPKSFQGADLRGVTLSGNLDQVDFRGADLRGATITRNSSLIGAQFQCADLRGSTFGGTLKPASIASAITDNIHGKIAEDIREVLASDRDEVLLDDFKTELEDRFGSRPFAAPEECPTKARSTDVGTAGRRAEIAQP